MDERLLVGAELSTVTDIEETLQYTRSSGYDYIACPLVHPRYQRSFSDEVQRDEPLTRSDMLLSSSDWASVVGKISSWIDCDSEDTRIRTRSEKVPIHFDFLRPL